MRRVLATLILASASCTAPTVQLEKPSTNESSIVVETWDVALTVSSDPIYPVLRDGIIAQLKTDPSDVVCLSNLRFDADEVSKAVESNFPHRVYRASDPSSVPDDTHDLTGNVPTPPSTPPCGVGEEAAYAEMVDCVKTCAAGRDSFELSCVKKSCTGDKLSTRCQACFAAAANESKPSDLRAECFTRNDGELQNKPRTDAVLLSKRPLKDAKYHVFPGWLNQTAVVEATVSAFGRDVVVVCATTMLPLDEPYGGIWGAPFQPGTQNYGELMMHLSQIIDVAWPRRAMPTLLLGTMPAIWGVSRSGKITTGQELWTLQANFDPLFVPENGLGCLTCSNNALALYFGVHQRDWVAAQVVTSQHSGMRAVSVDRVGGDATVPFEGKNYTPSTSYGVRVAVELPPQGAI